MKVVLFCGGYGMRMRANGDDDTPKPMQPVGPRPLIWHVMRYYAHFGHREFILCLGYGAHHLKQYFLDYRETESNDFVMRNRDIEVASSDIADWTIHFVHTGLDASIGERLRRVRHLVDDDEMFLANYADVLTDLPLDEMVARFTASDARAALLAVPPVAAFHVVETDEDRVKAIRPAVDMDLFINGGYFVLRPEVIDLIPPGGDLVADACQTLAAEGTLMAHRYHGFWQSADTVKERNELEAAYQSGRRPWMLWEERDGDVPPLQGLVNRDRERRR
ncbi:glucose-1-phosphate cytidylyltransferase [Nocardioides marinquilinus]|uniref:Glucose-1-phosphate cytidylyltransferase n=1 Tax=Nocardioides marinquilinus TaxID=1210400 RepID=A0ABP9PAD0_9ACTN